MMVGYEGVIIFLCCFIMFLQLNTNHSLSKLEDKLDEIRK